MDAARRALEPALEARCQSHPDEPARGACARCGAFFCGKDGRDVDGQLYCLPCAERPDVDHLEVLRKQYWGRRDGWTWFVGLVAAFFVVLAVAELNAVGRTQWLLVGPALTMGAVGGLFWWGMPFARPLLVLLPVLGMGLSVFTTGSPLAIAPWVLPLAVTIGIYRDTRNKLFFKLEVPRETLRKVWDVHDNNPAARSGFLLSFFGMFIPVFIPFGLVSSIVGLMRVDPTARPPVGHRSYALAGIFVGVVALLGWVGFFMTLVASKGGR